MKYILCVDVKGLNIVCFTGIEYVMKEIPKEVLTLNINGVRNITQDYLATQDLNEHLGTNFDIMDFSQTLGVGDAVYFVKQYIRNNEKVYRYYHLDIKAETDKFVRKAKPVSVDKLIAQCNEANRIKATRSKNDQSIDDRSRAIRDYFNRVDKAWRLYDSALLKAKPDSHLQLAYNKRTLEKDLDIAFKKACDANVSVEDIRDVENQVIRERIRRIENAQQHC